MGSDKTYKLNEKRAFFFVESIVYPSYKCKAQRKVLC